jgi:hypothetical protein
MWILIVYVLIVVAGEAVVVAIGLPWIEFRRWPVCQFPCRYSSPCSRLDGLWQCVGLSPGTQKA